MILMLCGFLVEGCGFGLEGSTMPAESEIAVQEEAVTVPTIEKTLQLRPITSSELMRILKIRWRSIWLRLKRISISIVINL